MDDTISISGWAKDPSLLSHESSPIWPLVPIFPRFHYQCLRYTWPPINGQWGRGKGVLDLKLNCWTVKLATHLHLESSWKIRIVYIHITNVIQSKVLAFRKKFYFELVFLQINSLNVSEQTLRVEFLTPIPCLSLHSLPRTCDTDIRHNNVRGMFLSFWIQMPPQGWTNLDILTDRTLCLGSVSNGEQRWGVKYNLVAKLRVSASCRRTCLMYLPGLPVTETTPYGPSMRKVS